MEGPRIEKGPEIEAMKQPKVVYGEPTREEARAEAWKLVERIRTEYVEGHYVRDKAEELAAELERTEVG